jgi:hypothetical protein
VDQFLRNPGAFIGTKRQSFLENASCVSHHLILSREPGPDQIARSTPASTPRRVRCGVSRWPSAWAVCWGHFWGHWKTTHGKVDKVDSDRTSATVPIHKDIKPSKLLSASS